MKAGTRPQYYRIRRMVQMIRDGLKSGILPNSADFMREFGISRRTVARDLDFLRDEENAPVEYDDIRHGFRLTDETYTLPPVRISRREAFSFALARKLVCHDQTVQLPSNSPFSGTLAKLVSCLTCGFVLATVTTPLQAPPSGGVVDSSYPLGV